PRPRETLQAADEPGQAADELLLLVAAQLNALPALRQPHLSPADDQLEGEQRGDDLKDVGGPTGGQGQGRDPQQDDEHDGEALLAEGVDEGPEGSVAVPLQPLLELVAELRVGLGGGPGCVRTVDRARGGIEAVGGSGHRRSVAVRGYCPRGTIGASS